jgi:hypothetical protein
MKERIMTKQDYLKLLVFMKLAGRVKLHKYKGMRLPAEMLGNEGD